jgi:molybdate transport system ATP-binding protein
MRSKLFLELAGISLRLEDRILFRNTHWTFARDENWALLGKNGSGKTLLARAIAGEIPIVEGEIRCHFRPPAGRLPEDGIMLVSFEQQRAIAGDAPDAMRWFSLEQDLSVSVREFLSQNNVEEINPFEVNARRMQTPRAFRRNLRHVIHLLQIGPLLGHSLPSLSTGEMRKVLLARALLRKPRLLILDDIFAGLDAKYRVHLKKILQDLMARGFIRLLLVSPSPAELPRGITHVLLVDKCTVAAHGPHRSMLRHPGVLAISPTSKISGKSRNSVSRFARRRSGCEQKELVRLENVSVQYDGQAILSGINWTIRRGESWALSGPNGSGKSTLLSLISGDNPQSYANSVRLFGRSRGNGESLWEWKQRIGAISSELHLHFPEGQTCLETVISGFHDSLGYYRRASAAQRDVARRILDRFGLLPLAESCFGFLSAGSQRMVLLARALVKSPDLLLLDEPCQGLDLTHRTIFLRNIEELLRRGETTMIYVTHVPSEIPHGIHRLLRLRNGRIFNGSADRKRTASS